jgi:hypothetical protein
VEVLVVLQPILVLACLAQIHHLAWLQPLLLVAVMVAIEVEMVVQVVQVVGLESNLVQELLEQQDKVAQAVKAMTTQAQLELWVMLVAVVELTVLVRLVVQHQAVLVVLV